jgi:hypothetical protein
MKPMRNAERGVRSAEGGGAIRPESELVLRIGLVGRVERGAVPGLDVGSIGLELQQPQIHFTTRRLRLSASHRVEVVML